MIITAITPDKKHLVKLSFDNGEECLLDRNVCINFGLYTEMELCEEKLQVLKAQSDYERAKSRALWYLDRGDLTEKALFQKLVRGGFSQKASAKVLARFCELGLIDDRRFAERFCDRCLESNISKREALQKMLQKGVPYDLAKEMLENSETDEETQIKNLLEGKYASKLNAENGKQKVFAALARKGFSFSAIRSVMNEYISDLEFCEGYDV